LTESVHDEAQRKIKRDTQYFLDNGGQITKIPRGVSAEKKFDLSTKSWKKKNV